MADRVSAPLVSTTSYVFPLLVASVVFLWREIRTRTVSMSENEAGLESLYLACAGGSGWSDRVGCSWGLSLAVVFICLSSGGSLV